MKRVAFKLGFFFFCFTIPFCVGQKIEVTDGLVGLFHDLHDESFHSAIIISPFITAWDILQVSTEKGRKIFVITLRKNIKDYIKYISQRKNFALYTTDLHSKMFLMLDNNDGMKGYIGSANFTRNSANNNELVLVISNPEEIPGFIPFINELLKKSLLHTSVLQTERPLPKTPPKNLVRSLLTKKRGEPAGIELVSYFDFHAEQDYDLILWIADRIKIEKKHNYLISSMTFNYPAFMKKIKRAVKKGSTFKVLVDKASLRSNPSKFYALVDLIRFSKNHSQNIAIRWSDGRGGTEASVHHAKLFVRLPESKTGKGGISIVSTANFTKAAGKVYNSALALPFDSTDPLTIIGLNSQFNNWWEKSEEIPLEELESCIRAQKVRRSYSCSIIGGSLQPRVIVPKKSLSESTAGLVERDRAQPGSSSIHEEERRLGSSNISDERDRSFSAKRRRFGVK